MCTKTYNWYSTLFHRFLLHFSTFAMFASVDTVLAVKQREHILQEAKKNIIHVQAKQSAAYDKKQHFNPEVFKVAGMVLKKDFKRKRKGGKLDTKWEGLYEIVCSLGRDLYCLRDVHHPNKVLSCVSGMHLKKYILPSNTSINVHS